MAAERGRDSSISCWSEIYNCAPYFVCFRIYVAYFRPVFVSRFITITNYLRSSIMGATRATQESAPFCTVLLSVHFSVLCFFVCLFLFRFFGCSGNFADIFIAFIMISCGASTFHIPIRVGGQSDCWGRRDAGSGQLFRIESALTPICLTEYSRRFTWLLGVNNVIFYLCRAALWLPPCPPLAMS